MGRSKENNAVSATLFSWWRVPLLMFVQEMTTVVEAKGSGSGGGSESVV